MQGTGVKLNVSHFRRYHPIEALICFDFMGDAIVVCGVVVYKLHQALSGQLH